MEPDDGNKVPPAIGAGALSTLEASAIASPKPPLREIAKPTARFAFVDGLRGLAALSIVVFHVWLYEPAPFPTLEHTPWLLEQAFRRTRGGVHVLLVISGFVIAYTLRKTWFTPAEMFWFLARRLVRLAPAYWVAIAFVVLVDVYCRTIGDLPSPFEGKLSVPRVVAHATFMQDVAGHTAISAGMWTLCIEMQFYVVAILTWGLAQRLFPRPVKNEPQPSAWGLLLLFGPASLMSLFIWRPMESTEPYVTHFLWMFFLGMTTWWTLDRTLSRLVFLSLVLIGAVELTINGEWWFQNSVALLTALSIFAAGSLRRLDVWLTWRPLQYLGRISYSLYLIHFPVSHLVTSVGWKYYGSEPTSAQAAFVLLTALSTSLLAGQVLYVLVEAPSARWAAMMKNSATQSSATTTQLAN